MKHATIKKCSYASSVGMLIYLAGNAQPEITFSVHKCTSFTHPPCQSNSWTIRHISRYLESIDDDKLRLIGKPTGALALKVYVNTDFSGLWNHDDDQDLIRIYSTLSSYERCCSHSSIFLLFVDCFQVRKTFT